MLRLRLHSTNAALGQTLVELCQHRIERVELAGLGGLGGRGRGGAIWNRCRRQSRSRVRWRPARVLRMGACDWPLVGWATAHGLATDCAASGRLNVQTAERAWTSPIWHLA